METRFGAGETADLERDRSAAVDRALADAAAEINGLLSTSYDLPLAAGTYPQLAEIQCHLARLRLYDESAPERVLGNASAARGRLRRIADGRTGLVTGDGSTVRREALVRTSGPDPVMTADALEGF